MSKTLTDKHIKEMSFSKRDIIDKVFRYSLNLFDSKQLDRKLNLIAYENSDTGVRIEDFLWEYYGAVDSDLVGMYREKDGYSIAATYYFGENYDDREEIMAKFFYDESFALKSIEVNLVSGELEIWRV